MSVRLCVYMCMHAYASACVRVCVCVSLLVTDTTSNTSLVCLAMRLIAAPLDSGFKVETIQS